MFSSRLVTAAIGCALLATFSPLVIASPTPKHQPDTIDLASRSIGLQPWAWDSVPFERSPSDPELERRVVYNPRITSPGVGSIWTAGTKETVTWSTADMPKEVISSASKLMLGYKLVSGKGGLNLHYTLADGFPIDAGKVSFKLPADLPLRTDYIVVLFGDSGNDSPTFTILPSNTSSVSGKNGGLNLVSVLEEAVGVQSSSAKASGSAKVKADTFADDE